MSEPGLAPLNTQTVLRMIKIQILSVYLYYQPESLTKNKRRKQQPNELTNNKLKSDFLSLPKRNRILFF